VGPAAVRLTGKASEARSFYRALGLKEGAPGRWFDPAGHTLILADSPEPPGAVLVWPGEPGVFYDLEGNLHRTEAVPDALPGAGPRLLGVLYAVVDLPDSIAWYERERGLALTLFDPGSDWAELESEGGLSVLLTFGSGDERRGVAVFQVPDAARWVEELRGKGLEPAWTRSTAWGRLAAYADPFGNPLLFIDRSGSGSGP